MENMKEAIKYLVDLGEEKNFVKEIGGISYSNSSLRRIEAPTPRALKTSTLTSVVDYVNKNIDKVKKENMFIHIESADRVSIVSELNNEMDRNVYMISNAIIPTQAFDQYMSMERFNIALQARFVSNVDLEKLLVVSSNVVDEDVKTVVDNGVGQVATMRTGLAQQEQVLLPNPIILKPYRTFPEVEQVESKYVFRMRKGPEAALFEADGGNWKNIAIKNIKEFLTEKIDGDINIIA